jgi:hypothetical protein
MLDRQMAVKSGDSLTKGGRSFDDHSKDQGRADGTSAHAFCMQMSSVLETEECVNAAGGSFVVAPAAGASAISEMVAAAAMPTLARVVRNTFMLPPGLSRSSCRSLSGKCPIEKPAGGGYAGRPSVILGKSSTKDLVKK